MTNTGRWNDALDDFERTLAVAVAAIDEAERRHEPHDEDALHETRAGFGPIVLQPFVPPVIAEPFPPALLERANGLLGRAARLTSRIRLAQDGIRQELARLPRSRPPEAAGESRFEAHA
jgi:hypothetical protein